MLKDTIIWFLVSGLVICFNSISSKKNERYFKELLYENLKIVLILEFFINSQTFSLTVELVLVFLFTFIVAVLAFSEINEEFKSVYRFFERISTIGGFLILFAVIRSFILNIREFELNETIKAFFLPIILTVSILPAAYLILIYSKYETLFVRLKVGCEKTPSLNRYAKRKLFGYGRLNLSRLNQLLSSHQTDLMQLGSKSEMNVLLNMYRNDRS